MAQKRENPDAGGVRARNCDQSGKAIASENSISQRLDAIANSIDPLAADLDLLDALVQLADEMEAGQ
ncbi:hypothetical protein [Methylocystis sp.]|uniref:hypothetical protein n=1 Tax=Methylocystis sp. TaxID=1911079 RepID=UPI003DA57FE2